MKAVIVTRPDGGVSIIYPSQTCIRLLATGGGINTAVRGRVALGQWLEAFPWWQRLHWHIRDRLPLDIANRWEVHKLVECPTWRRDRANRERIARQWVEALANGGCSEVEAVSLIAEHSAPLWSTAHDIVEVTEIPTDRTHRDLWRRSANGGPIWIDEMQMQKIDERRMWEKYEGMSASC